jgi:hypothetical protein
MWGLVLAIVLVCSAFVAASRLWGSQPSSLRLVASTFAAIFGAMLAWGLTDRFVGLSDDRDVQILGLITIVLAGVSVRAGRNRIADTKS